VASGRSERPVEPDSSCRFCGRGLRLCSREIRARVYHKFIEIGAAAGAVLAGILPGLGLNFFAICSEVNGGTDWGIRLLSWYNAEYVATVQMMIWPFRVRKQNP
jgi:hypothetical protein